MTIKEELEEVMSRDCKVDGVLNKDLCAEKLHDLTCLLYKASCIVGGSERHLSQERINLLQNPAFYPNFKSGRELDRNLDDHCAEANEEKIVSALLYKGLLSEVESMKALVYYLSK